MVGARCLLPVVLATAAVTFANPESNRLEAIRTASQSELVIQKEGTNEYHRPWCPIVRDGGRVLALTRAQATARGLKSHADCEKAPETAATSGRVSAPRRPAPPTFVYVDGTKYYHREKCPRSVGAVQRVAVEAAAKTRWPCPACRPPIPKRGDGPAIPERRRRI